MSLKRIEPTKDSIKNKAKIMDPHPIAILLPSLTFYIISHIPV
jgi:hypothetical protein